MPASSSSSLTRALFFAAVLAFAASLGFVARAAFSAGDQVQGDVNCDTHVNASDILGELHHVAEVTPAAQNEPCTDIGAVLPQSVGPQGPKGDKGDKGDTGDPGPKGDKGDPGVNLFSNVTVTGTTATQVNGNATAVSRVETGVYIFNFGVNIKHCAAVASAGTTHSSNYANDAIATTAIDLDNTQDGVMEVFIADIQGNFVDHDFHVIVVC